MVSYRQALFVLNRGHNQGHRCAVEVFSKPSADEQVIASLRGRTPELAGYASVRGRIDAHDPREPCPSRVGGNANHLNVTFLSLLMSGVGLRGSPDL